MQPEMTTDPLYACRTIMKDIVMLASKSTSMVTHVLSQSHHLDRFANVTKQHQLVPDALLSVAKQRWQEQQLVIVHTLLELVENRVEELQNDSVTMEEELIAGRYEVNSLISGERKKLQNHYTPIIDILTRERDEVKDSLYRVQTSLDESTQKQSNGVNECSLVTQDMVENLRSQCHAKHTQHASMRSKLEEVHARTQLVTANIAKEKQLMLRQETSCENVIVSPVDAARHQLNVLRSERDALPQDESEVTALVYNETEAELKHIECELEKVRSATKISNDKITRTSDACNSLCTLVRAFPSSNCSGLHVHQVLEVILQRNCEQTYTCTALDFTEIFFRDSLSAQQALSCAVDELVALGIVHRENDSNSGFRIHLLVSTQ